jgi:hypothetical protein
MIIIIRFIFQVLIKLHLNILFIDQTYIILVNPQPQNSLF